MPPRERPFHKRPHVLFLIVSAGVLIALLLAMTGFWAMMQREYSRVFPAAEAILEDWRKADYEALYAATSPHWKTRHTREQMTGLWRAINRELGPLLRWEKPAMELHTNPNSPKLAILRYDAEFEKGPARMTLRLLQTADGWDLAGYRIQSPLLEMEIRSELLPPELLDRGAEGAAGP